MRPRQLPKFHQADKFKGTARLLTELLKMLFTTDSERIFLTYHAYLSAFSTFSFHGIPLTLALFL